MDLQLYINGEVIEIDQNLIAPLTYSVADVKSPEKRSRNSSKTIKIKGTQNNMRIMYPTYNLSLKDDGAGFNFNPNAELSARIVRGGVVIFQGVANYQQATFKNGSWTFDYKVYGTSVGLFELLGDKKLSELDWSEYDHTLTTTILAKSWDTYVVLNGTPTANFTAGIPDGFGYIYPLINYGYSSNQLTPKTNELLPYFYMKEAFEKCFAVGGYTIIGDWIDAEFTKRMIFGKGGGERVTISSAEVAARQVNYNVAGSKNDFAQKYTHTNNSGVLTKYGYSKVYNMGDLSPNSTTIVTDPRLQFDEATGIATIQSSGSYNLSFDLTLNYNVDFSFPPVGLNEVGLQLAIRTFVNGGATTAVFANTIFDWERVGSRTMSVNSQSNLLAGDEVYFQFFIYTNSHNYAQGYTAETAPDLAIDYTITSSSFNITSLDAILTEGDTVFAGSALPDMTCRDFMNSIIGIYNLYFSDPNDDKEVRVEPFEDYYLGNDTADNYTDKLDYEEPIVIKSNAGIEGKTYNFNWAEDHDFHHDYYFARWGTYYGNLKYQVPTTFKKGDKDYKVSFAQTIPVDVGSLVIPQIIQRDPATGLEGVHKGKPRIMIYNGLQSGNWDLLNSATGAATALTTYPQAHHVDNVVTPTYDFNFGTPTEIYYTTSNYTTNNLFGLHYDVQIKELTSQDSKFLEANFKIDERDLQGEFMRTLVNVNGVTYRKNLIKDFDPSGFGTTKHELIKLIDPTLRAAQSVPYTDPTGGGGSTSQLRLTNQTRNYNESVAVTDTTLDRFSSNVIIADSSGGVRNIVLADDTPDGFERTITRSGASVVNVSAETGTISGLANVELSYDYDSYTFMKDADFGWLIKTAYSTTIGSSIFAITTVTTTTSTSSSFMTYVCDTTSGSFTITLTTTGITTGQIWNIKKSVAANTLTIDTESGTVIGETSVEITETETNYTLQFDGTNFILI